MISNYLIYFFNLLPTEQAKQISAIFIFFYSILVVCLLLLIFKFQFFNVTKESCFQKFLKRI